MSGSMADPISNTRVTTSATNIREDLADMIMMIDPSEAPLASNIGGTDATAVTHEWLVQELNAAADNEQKEGWRIAAQSSKIPDRLNNVCQIMVRMVTVSGTYSALNSVEGDEFDRQLILKGLELRRDLEKVLTGVKVKTTVDPRRMSSVQCYITNGSMGAGTGAMPAGTGAGAPVAGTGRTMTLNLVSAGVQAAYEDGGNPDLILVCPTLKTAFSALSAGGAGNVHIENVIQSTRPEPVTLVTAVDVFRSDFGTHQVAADRFMPTDVLIGVETQHLRIAAVPGRNFSYEEMAKTGDAQDGGVLLEGCLEVSAPKAHFLVGDLTG